MPVRSVEIEGQKPRRSPPRVARKSDIERAIKTVQQCGLVVGRVEVDGLRVVVHTTEGDPVQTPLEEWRRKRGQG